MSSTAFTRDFTVTEKDTADSPENSTEFEKLATEKQLSLTQEFFVFVMENKKWWLVPILLVFSIVGGLVALASTGAAPFIYTLF